MKSIEKTIKKKYKSIIFKFKVVYLTRINTLLLLRNLYTIQHIFTIKKTIAALSLITLAGSWVPVYNLTQASGQQFVYPIQEMSKLNCRFQKFSELTSDCKRKLPILKTKDYKKYIKQNGGYNDYTRIYTVLWGSSYKYGWDVGNGGHGGTDIASAEGTPVYAVTEGKVINASFLSGWGNTVSIEHTIDGKKIVSNYSHLSKINTKNGAKVKAGTKIGEVGNTGNSFGNHLHFQIDVRSTYHPFYYDLKTCPYSFNKISESDICFDQLKTQTIDPLAFLESKGAILDKIDISKTSQTLSKDISKTATPVKTFSQSEELPEILSTYVHIDSEAEDIKKLQKVFSDMGIYKGLRSGKYSDIQDMLIAYQIDRGVIENKDDLGAGYFGPKTRTQAQQDYKKYLEGETIDALIEFSTTRLTNDSQATKPKIENNIEIEKIAKTELLTREEIQLREVQEFQNEYQIDLKFDGTMGNVGLGDTEQIKFLINRSNGRPFRGNTPGNITIETDESIVKVFPNTFFSFTDGRRDISITGLKKGVTSLKVKMGDTELKSFKINVVDDTVTVVPSSGSVLSAKRIVFGEEKTGFVVMRDSNNTRLINLEYEGEYILKSETDTKFCLKKTNMKDIKKSLTQRCSADEFSSEIRFDYDDTAEGILVFDYKVGQKKASMTLLDAATAKSMDTKRLLVTNPKGLNAEYAYSDEVIALLEKGIVGGISRGYFLEDRELSHYDANEWIKNTLVSLKDSTNSPGQKAQIQERIDKLSKQNVSEYSYLSRRGFLELATEKLVFDDVIPEVTIEYRDLNDDENKRANLAFDSSNTWKDRFGENYYRPKEKISRGEGAYLISRVLEKKTSDFVTLR